MGGGGGGGGKKRFTKSKGAKSSSLFVQGGVLSYWSPVGSSPPSRAKSSNIGEGESSRSASRSGNSGGKKGASSSASKSEYQAPRGGCAFGYVYPTVDRQEGLLVDGGKSGDDNMDMSDTITMVNTKNTQVVAYVDQTPFMESQRVKYTYECSAVLGFDDASHKGLGFSDEVGTTSTFTKSFRKRGVKEGSSLSTPSSEEKSQEGSLTPFMEPQNVKYTYECTAGLGSEDTRGLGFSDEVEITPSFAISSPRMRRKEDPELDSPSSEEKSEEEMETEGTYIHELGDDLLSETPYLEKNSGYLSIGGMRLYTQDISNGDSEEWDEEELSDGESLESSESEESSGSSDSDSSIDEDIAEDYFEGIGSSERVVNTDQLVGKLHYVVDNDDGFSGGSFNETLQRMGGIDLQDASREYGMKPKSGRKDCGKSSKSGTNTYGWSSALDDLMIVKDHRTVSGKKKHGATFPRSWPSEKGKQFRRFPGEKKKHHKETIALKRRERMIRRGVDLEEINLKLQQLVLDGKDMLSFQPMHSRDCSQVRRLAGIYRLRSGCQGSGKKRFVTVIRTERTCMPSSSDRIRLEKLIGACDEDADFTVNNIKSSKGDRKTVNKASKGSGSGSAPKKSFKKLVDHSGTKEAKRKNKSEEKVSYALQPLSFVSSGIMHSETEISTLNTETDNSTHNKKGVASSSSYGAFELHTTGFGSKMMAKMGYIEGEGLGKDGKGRADLIEVVQRPKSLGLGANVPETSNADSIKVKQCPNKASSSGTKGLPETNNRMLKKEFQQFAAFERHTKGFGSKMMAKMGFVEGTGLGRDSQGIVNPLVASRLPKSRGLGAKG